MKRLLCLLMVLLILCGCGSKQENVPAEGTANEEETIKEEETPAVAGMSEDFDIAAGLTEERTEPEDGSPSSLKIDTDHFTYEINTGLTIKRSFPFFCV